MYAGFRCITILTRPRIWRKPGQIFKCSQSVGKLAAGRRNRVAHATRLPGFVLAQGISIANEITGTYRSGIRPDGLLGFDLVTSRPRSPSPLPPAHWTTTKHGNAYCAPTCLRPHCFAPEISIDFRTEDAVKRATHSFPLHPFLSNFWKNIIPVSRHVGNSLFFFFTKLAVFHLSEQLETELKIFFVALNYVDLNSVYSSTQYSFFLFFTQLGNSNSPGEVT